MGCCGAVALIDAEICVEYAKMMFQLRTEGKI
jgi:hypothetical protein